MKFSESELYLMHSLVIGLDRIARESLLEPFKVTFNEFLVLMAVREMSSPVHQDVARYLDISKSLVSQRVRLLVERKLLRQVQNRENRREVILVLTAKGRTQVEKMYEILLSAGNRLFESLGTQRDSFRLELTLLLSRLRPD